MINFALDINQAFIILRPVAFFVLGVVIYAIFVFHFYRFLAKKDIFKLNLNQYNRAKFPFLKKFIRTILYIIEYLLIFPLFSFFWFGILTVLLSFLAKDPVVNNILIISIALVSAIRVTAYYNEDLSKDLAKMLPFALLGIYLVDAAYFSLSESLEFIKQIPSAGDTIIYYLLFAISLELVLRITSLLFFPNRKKMKKNERNEMIPDSENND